MYKKIFRPLAFALDAETAHHFTFQLLRFFLRFGFIKQLLKRNFATQKPVKVAGLTFPNRVGLAAGFDKDARIGTDWKYLGFGFVEIGTITPRPQVGNPPKRLFRLPQDSAILNRMGFNNGGVKMAVERLQKMDKSNLILGANIGKNKDTPNEKAVADYVICFDELFAFVDYFVVNVSSPNTPGLRELQEKEPLLQLLQTLQNLNQTKPNPKPIFLKIAPDLTFSQLDDIVEVVQQSKIAGVVATNTTLSKEKLITSIDKISEMGNGGISGKPLTHRATEVIRYLHEKSNGSFSIIGVGGIFSKQDAEDKLAAGADLVQIYTGFIYEGPKLVKEIAEI